MNKASRKIKSRVKYYKAPQKSRAACFFTSFFLTLAVCICAAGFLVADVNSQRIGWGKDIEVFAFDDSGGKIDFTVMGNDYTLNQRVVGGVREALRRLRLARLCVEPSPVQFAGMAGLRLGALEGEVLDLAGRSL